MKKVCKICKVEISILVIIWIILSVLLQDYEIMINQVSIDDIRSYIVYLFLLLIGIILWNVIKNSYLNKSQKRSRIFILLFFMFIAYSGPIAMDAHFINTNFYMLEFEEDSDLFDGTIIVKENDRIVVGLGDVYLMKNSWLLKRISDKSYKIGSEIHHSPMETGFYRLTYNSTDNILIFEYSLNDGKEWLVMEISMND